MLHLAIVFCVWTGLETFSQLVQQDEDGTVRETIV